MNQIINEVEKEFLRKEKFSFNVGDTVNVYIRHKEGDRERIQVFQGVVIAKKHGGIRETFTVRRVIENQAVECIFPLHSPNIVKVEVEKKGRVRRAKLYYLREKVGKKAKIESGEVSQQTIKNQV